MQVWKYHELEVCSHRFLRVYFVLFPLLEKDLQRCIEFDQLRRSFRYLFFQLLLDLFLGGRIGNRPHHAQGVAFVITIHDLGMASKPPPPG
jgi:hypothetical protein